MAHREVLVFAFGLGLGLGLVHCSPASPRDARPSDAEAGDAGSGAGGRPRTGDEEALAAWNVVAAPAGDLRALSCPDSAQVHAATSMGLFRLDGETWSEVAAGSFDAVDLADGDTGYASGDGGVVRKDGSAWKKLSGLRAHAVRAAADGVWACIEEKVGVEKNGGIAFPTVVFLRSADGTIVPERAYGTFPQTFRDIRGDKESVAVAGGLGAVARWDGVRWSALEFELYSAKRVAMVGTRVFATDGTTIETTGGTYADGPGGAIEQLLSHRGRLLAITSRLVDVHAVTAGTDEVVDIEAEEAWPPAPPIAACVTRDGFLWVGGKERVFRRMKPL